MGKTKTIHLFLTFQLSSLEKNNSKFIGKHHWMIQNLNQVSFYKRNSAASAVKIDCQERKGFREVSTRQRKMIL